MEENKEVKPASATSKPTTSNTANVGDKKPSRPNPAKAVKPAGAPTSQPSSRPNRPFANGSRPAFNNHNNPKNPNAPRPHFAHSDNASSQPSDGSKPTNSRPRFSRPDGQRNPRPHFNRQENADNAKKPLNPNASANTANPSANNNAVAEDEEGKKVFVKKFKHNPKFKRPIKTGPELEEKVIEVKRISKTTKGGRKLRFSALVVVGDRKGTVGYGLAKANEVPDALKKAIRKAHNNLYKVKMTRDGSLYHEATGRSSSGKVLLKPAPVGTGIIAGGPIRAIVELAGYSDIYSKNQGTNASINMVRATINALMQQRTIKDVAAARDLPINKLFH